MGVRVVFPDMGKDPSIQLIEKTITENGTYDAITDGANGYSKVNVNVEGGGGETWNTVFEGNVTTEVGSDPYPSYKIQGQQVTKADYIKVSLNGVEYELPKVSEAPLGYGELGGDPVSFDTYPLFIGNSSDSIMVFTQTAGTYTLKIEEPQSGGGSSDFSTAEVTVTRTQAQDASYMEFMIIKDNNPTIFATDTAHFNNEDSVILTFILYKGEQKIGGAWNDILTQASGNCEVDYDTGVLTVKGDCALTVAPQLIV